MPNYVKKFNVGGTEVSIGDYDDSAIRNDLSTETSERKAADTTLQTNIDNEAKSRSTKDSELQQAINTQKARIDKAYDVTYDAATETIKFTPIS